MFLICISEKKQSSWCVSVKPIFVLLINYRYADEEVVYFLLMSSVLDPRFKPLPWLNTDERDDVYEKLVAYIIQTQSPHDEGKDLAEPTTSDDLKE